MQLIPGCSKRSRCEAREKSILRLSLRTGSHLLPGSIQHSNTPILHHSSTPSFHTLERGDRSATKQVGLFQQPVEVGSPSAKSFISSATHASFSNSRAFPMTFSWLADGTLPRAQARNLASPSAGDMRLLGWPFGKMT